MAVYGARLAVLKGFERGFFGRKARGVMLRGDRSATVAVGALARGEDAVVADGGRGGRTSPRDRHPPGRAGHPGRVHVAHVLVLAGLLLGGGDQLGLVARLSHVFAQYGANIVRLEASEAQGTPVDSALGGRTMAAGSVQEGGSTLTQQLVKQTLLQTADTPEERSAATEQTLGRKLREARLALSLEQQYSKSDILTRYLNIVYFGHGAYGIQAAPQKYFSVNAIDLTLPQAAMLAGLVQSPTNDDPINHPVNAQIRRNQVLARMLTLGHITQVHTTISSGPIGLRGLEV